ncbi:MAG TPA: endonuclease/exonuclease/phosphatase family protein [Ktedonosporobacter sp.]|nr:endonuclease/exonuclease/phosphatase family protein [Ktedonosporobacter sp.]
MSGDVLKILSWNIQKFGYNKLNDDNFIKYVAQVILDSGADFVAIMEIVGWLGKDIKDKLISQLFNQSGVKWSGEESEMTPSKPNEQYVCLWKKDPLDQAAVKTYRIIGENDFKQFAQLYKVDQKKLEEVLKRHDYLDENYMVPEDKYEELRKDFKKLDLTPEFTLGDSEKKEIVDILLASEALGFPYPNSRPPFLVSAKLNKGVNKAAVNCFLMVFHAPGPTGFWPMIACSMLALVPEVKDTKSGNQPAVIMGDFNIDWGQISQQYTLYAFDRAKWGQLIPIRVPIGGTKLTTILTSTPFQRLTGPTISSKLKSSDPNYEAVQILDYKIVLNNQPTSITTTLVPDGTEADPQHLATLLSSTYDNFLVREGKFTKQEVLPLIAYMVPTIKNQPNPLYKKTQSQLAAKAFNVWWDEQNGRGVRKPDIINPRKTTNPITKIPNDTPTSLRQAHYIYRYAISDHLPIYMEFQYA